MLSLFMVFHSIPTSKEPSMTQTHPFTTWAVARLLGLSHHFVEVAEQTQAGICFEEMADGKFERLGVDGERSQGEGHTVQQEGGLGCIPPGTAPHPTRASTSRSPEPFLDGPALD